MKYRIERNRNYTFIYREFATAFLIVFSYFIYQLTQDDKILPLIIFICIVIILLLIIMFSLIYILKRKFIYFNTIDNIVEYQTYFGKRKIKSINEIDFEYRIITDNSVQFIFLIVLIGKSGKKLFKIWNYEMNVSEKDSKIILNMLIDNIGFNQINNKKVNDYFKK